MRDIKSSLTHIFRGRVVPVIGMLLVFIISFSVLYYGENVGLSDNGDFRRVLLTNNISYADETDYHYLFKEHYIMELDETNTFKAMVSAWQTNKEEEIYSSPHFLIIKISKELNVIANAITHKPLSEYDIVYMALLYIFMLSLAAGVLFTFFAGSKVRIQIAVFVLFIFMFCDAGYLLYFNSFYGEPLQYTAFMMLAAFGMMIYKRPSVPKVIGFYIALYFFAGSKLANIPYSLLIAILGIYITIMRKDKLFKIGTVITAITCIITIGNLYHSIPDWMTRDTTYQSVFFGITKDSKTPEKDLEELGVDKKYAVLSGTHAYMDGDEYPIDIQTDEFKRDFYDKVSKLDITSFYLRHPGRFLKEMCTAIENSAYIRPPVVGNSSIMPMEFTQKYSYWSKIRVALKFLYVPWVVLICFTVITIYMLFMNIFYIHNHKIETPEKRYMIGSLDVLIFGLWVNLALPIVANGEGDITKHMFLFTNCIDILFFVCIVGITVQKLKTIGISIVLMAMLSGMFHIHLPKKHMTFGTVYGEPIEWRIEEKFKDGSMMLVTEKSIREMKFDLDSNDWETSDLRIWLNGEFLKGFTEEEKTRIVTTENEIPVNYDNRDEAEEGNHPHYWNFTRALVNDLGDSAYRKKVRDRVYLPTLSMIKKIDTPDSYWILCPYTSNTDMQRFMNDDGFILHTYVKNEKGVRAVIIIK